MSNLDIFHNTTKSVPQSDSQIVRVGMEQIDIGGRKSHLPKAEMSPELALSHVPSGGSTPGTK